MAKLIEPNRNSDYLAFWHKTKTTETEYFVAGQYLLS